MMTSVLCVCCINCISCKPTTFSWRAFSLFFNCVRCSYYSSYFDLCQVHFQSWIFPDWYLFPLPLMFFFPVSSETTAVNQKAHWRCEWLIHRLSTYQLDHHLCAQSLGCPAQRHSSSAGFGYIFALLLNWPLRSFLGMSSPYGQKSPLSENCFWFGFF